MSSKTFPTTDLERELFSNGARFIISIDEVGRGALAGPVAVGAVLIDTTTDLANTPSKLQDSKLMTPASREALEPAVKDWVVAHAVGLASASEIDSIGIVRSLALAAGRAMDELLAKNEKVLSEREFTRVILDGTHDWLSAQSRGMRVLVRAKADRDCASVAAASVIAKVHRDRLMVELDRAHPGYGLGGHKGYGAATHIAAIRNLGPSPEHRVTWLSNILNDGVLSGLEEFTSE